MFLKKGDDRMGSNKRSIGGNMNYENEQKNNGSVRSATGDANMNYENEQKNNGSVRSASVDGDKNQENKEANEEDVEGNKNNSADEKATLFE